VKHRALPLAKVAMYSLAGMFLLAAASPASSQVTISSSAVDIEVSGRLQFQLQTSSCGDGTPDVTAKDINRALYLYVVACLINAMWVAAIAMVRFSGN